MFSIVPSDITVKTVIFGLILLEIICRVSLKTSSEHGNYSEKDLQSNDDYLTFMDYDKNEMSEESDDRIQKRIRTNQGFWCVWCDLFVRRKKKPPAKPTRRPTRVRTTTATAVTTTVP